MTIRNALEIHAFEERIEDYKKQKTNAVVTSYEWALQDWYKKLIITNQWEEEMLKDREVDGRIVFEVEQANKSLR
jgi:hypothetical protein